MFYGASGKPLRSFGAFGTRRKLPLQKLEAGMMLCENIIGKGDRILAHEGEKLSQKHVKQIRGWCDRPGDGCLLRYTREVWVKAALGSGDEVPKCETDPYAAHSIQKLYKAGTAVFPARLRSQTAARKTIMKIDGHGNVIRP